MKLSSVLIWIIKYITNSVNFTFNVDHIYTYSVPFRSAKYSYPRG